MRADVRLLIGGILAVAVPAAALHFTAGAARLAAGLTAAPFGWPRVLVGHLVCALPLGFLLAGRLRTIPGINAVPRVLWGFVALGVTGLAVIVLHGYGDTMATDKLGMIPLLAVRTTIALVLVLPWCVAATAPATPRRDSGGMGAWLGAGVGLALVPCGLYTSAVIEARTATATEGMESHRLARVERLLTGLVELGSDRPVAGRKPAELLRWLREELDRLDRRASSPLSDHAKPAEKFARVEAFMKLDRLDEAADLVRPLAATSLVATMTLATIERDRERWPESDAAYEAALLRILPDVAEYPEARTYARVVFEGLAYNARQDRRPREAERALVRGLQALPQEAPHFHFLLGRHYSEGGRPTLAAEHFREAARLDPATYQGMSDKMIRDIRTHTPACFP